MFFCSSIWLYIFISFLFHHFLFTRRSRISSGCGKSFSKQINITSSVSVGCILMSQSRRMGQGSFFHNAFVFHSFFCLLSLNITSPFFQQWLWSVCNKDNGDMGRNFGPAQDFLTSWYPTHQNSVHEPTFLLEEKHGRQVTCHFFQLSGSSSLFIHFNS